MKEIGTMRGKGEETEPDEAAPTSGERIPSVEDDPRADPEIARLMAERDQFLKPGETPFDYSFDRDPTRDEAPPSEGRAYVPPKTIPPDREHKTIPKLAVIVQLPQTAADASGEEEAKPPTAKPEPDPARDRPTVRRLQSPRSIPPDSPSDAPTRDRPNRVGLYLLVAAALTFIVLMFAYCGRAPIEERPSPAPSAPVARPTPSVTVTAATPDSAPAIPQTASATPSALEWATPPPAPDRTPTRSSAPAPASAGPKKPPANAASSAPPTTTTPAPSAAPTAEPKEIFDRRKSTDPKSNLDI